VMESGSLKDVTEDDIAVHRAIQAEDEGIAQGGMGDLRDGQRDDLHMASHLKRIATLDASIPEELAAIQRFEAHIAQHDLRWRQKTMMSPGLMMALQQPPYPGLGMVMGGQPGAPPPGKPGMNHGAGGPPGQSPQGANPGSRPPAGQPPGPVSPSGQA